MKVFLIVICFLFFPLLSHSEETNFNCKFVYGKKIEKEFSEKKLEKKIAKPQDDINFIIDIEKKKVIKIGVFESNPLMKVEWKKDKIELEYTNPYLNKEFKADMNFNYKIDRIGNTLKFVKTILTNSERTIPYSLLETRHYECKKIKKLF